MIEVRSLNVQQGAFSVRDVGFTIEAGEYAILMGTTGGGKTTLLESICGLRQVDSGHIFLDGVDVTNWLPGDRGLGYVPQDLALFPHLNVSEHLAFALKLRKVPKQEIRQRVDELSKFLGIEHLVDRTVHGLSGGESQRVALGRALVFRPRALLLDEPFSALDQETRSEMHTLVRRLTRDFGITTLHVTHSEEEALALADRRFLLKHGQLIEVNLQGLPIES
ncbi:ATP-binding cassette domain-containing protein [Thalassoglobus sp. JC818]|uniref:ATP-binding cassette domain-containing protein n=1 Tax=Thalassoglobus sp. JC818 TaxID=3232136 RepID=UPI0034581FF7